MPESTPSLPRSPALARWTRPVLLLVGLIGLLAVTRGMAATLYWDTNGATTGSSGANGTWGTNTYWSTNSAGTSATTGYTSGADAVFSAGSNATGAYTVTVNGTQNVSSLTVEEGTPTFSGGTINFSDTTPDFNVAAGLSVTVGSVISGTHGLNYGGGGSGILTLTGANTYSGTTTISNGFIIVGAGGTTGTLGTGNVVNNYGLLFNRSNAYTVSNVISGTGGLSQIGAGDLTLSGTNTYTGATTITTGTVSASTNAALGSTTGAAVSIYGGGTLDIAGNATADALNFGAKQFNIAGTGVGGAGAIVNSASVSQANAFQNIALTADATIGGIGRIDVRNGSATLDLAGYTLTKTGTNQLSVVGGTITDGNIVVNQGEFAIQTSTNAVAGSGTITLNSGTTLGLWGNTGTVTRALILNGATIFNESGSSTIGSNITLGGNSTVDATGTALTLSGNIGETGGARGLTKTSAGALTLTGTNTYSGTTTISAGTLNIGAGGTTGTLGTGNVVDNSSLVFNRSNAYAVSNVISGSGSLTQAGTGNITLSGANTYTGTTTISAGVVTLQQADALGNATNTTNTTVASGASLQLANNITTTNAGTLVLNGTGAGSGSLQNASGNNAWNSNVTLASNASIFSSTAGTLLTLGNTAGTSLFTMGANTVTFDGPGDTWINSNVGVTGDTGGLIKNGTGKLTFYGYNTFYTGATTVNAGSLDLVVGPFNPGIYGINGSLTIGTGPSNPALAGTVNVNIATNSYANQLSPASAVTINSDGALNVGSSTGLGSLTLNGGQVNITSGIILSPTGAITANANSAHQTSLISGGQVTLGAPTVFTVARDATNTSDLTVSAVVAGTSLVKQGAGVLTFTGTTANTYTGTTAINDGTLALNKTAGVNALGAGAVTVGDGLGSASSANLVLLASNQTSTAAAITLNADGRLALNNFSTSINTLGGTGLVDLATSGYLIVGASNGSSSFGGSITGTGTLEKTGTGTLTLQSNLILAGELRLSGGTLALNGFNLTAATLHLTGNTTIDFAGGNSTFTAANFIIDAGVTLTIANWSNAADYFFATNWTGAIPNTRGAAPMNEVTFNGFTAANTQWQGYDHQVTPVPEPAAYGAVLLGTLTLLFFRRRRTVIA